MIKIKNLPAIILCLSSSTLSQYALSCGDAVSATKTGDVAIVGDSYIARTQLQIERWHGQLEDRPESVFSRTQLSLATYRLAVYTSSSEKVDKAIHHMNKAILLASKEKPERFAQLLLARSTMLATQHRFERAWEDLQSIKELNVKAAFSLVAAEVKWGLGDYDKAEKIIREFAANEPSLRSLTRLAVLEFHLGNYKKAQELFAKAKKYDSEIDILMSSWLDVQMGIFDLKGKRYRQAEEHFRQACNKMPSYVLALEHLAEALVRQGRVEEASVLYKKVISISDDPSLDIAPVG